MSRTWPTRSREVELGFRHRCVLGRLARLLAESVPVSEEVQDRKLKRETMEVSKTTLAARLAELIYVCEQNFAAVEWEVRNIVCP